MGRMHSSLLQSPPLPIIPGTEGKGQLLCIIILELLFLLHPLHSLRLEDPVEQGFSHQGTQQTLLEGLLTQRGWAVNTGELRAVDSVSLGSV